MSMGQEFLPTPDMVGQAEGHRWGPTAGNAAHQEGHRQLTQERSAPLTKALRIPIHPFHHFTSCP